MVEFERNSIMDTFAVQSALKGRSSGILGTFVERNSSSLLSGTGQILGVRRVANERLNKREENR